MSRITLQDSTIDIMTKMSEDNPGALTALMECMKDGEKIDPDAFMGGLGVVLSLDTLGIYGTDIYVLWADICNRDTVKFIASIRAHQLGFISGLLLTDACSRQDYTGKNLIDVDDLYNKVCERLPDFDKINRGELHV